MEKGSNVEPGATGLLLGKEGRKEKNYSVSVLSTCILNPLKKVPHFVQVQSIAIDSFELHPTPPQNTGCGLAPLPPFSHGNAPDKNKDFQPTSN